MTFSFSTCNRTFSVEFSYTDWRAARKRSDEIQQQILENKANAVRRALSCEVPDPPYAYEMS